MKANTLILIIYFFLASFIGAAQPTVQKSNEDDKVCDMIATLPEVIKADKSIIKKTQGKRHLVTFIDNRPTTQHNYYVVTVAEYNGMNMVPHFNFIVDAKTHAIRYWDVLNDKFIPLQVWRKNHFKT